MITTTDSNLKRVKQLIRRRVKRGADLLDSKVVDWRSKIPSTFNGDDMHSLECCVIGRAFDSRFVLGLRELGIDPLGGGTIAYGFELAGDDATAGMKEHAWSLLAEEWLRKADEARP